MRYPRILATLALSATCVAIAMLADYLVTILLLRDYQGYTPLITLCIATLVSTPVTYVLVSNVYKLRAARDELAAARDAAVKANLSKTMFFANMSHELRTPLNAIIGFSQLLETDVFAAKRVEYARLIQQSGKHLLDLVNDLLDISKMEAGRFELEDTELSLENLMEECCEVVRTRMREAQLRLIRSVPRDLPLIIADKRAIKQIVLNLLTNAAKFTDAGGKVEVFAALLPGGEVMFGVRDNGMGIAPEEQARIFERYGRSRHEVVKLKEGAGLGLPIVKGLVEAHGGRVTLDSAPGRGTCVTIYLPAERVRSPQPAAARS